MGVMRFKIENNKELLDDIRNLIAQDNLREAFEIIKAGLSSRSNELSSIILLEARFSYLEKQKRLGSLSQREEENSMNLIRADLLSIIESLNPLQFSTKLDSNITTVRSTRLAYTLLLLTATVGLIITSIYRLYQANISPLLITLEQKERLRVAILEEYTKFDPVMLRDSLEISVKDDIETFQLNPTNVILESETFFKTDSTYRGLLILDYQGENMDTILSAKIQGSLKGDFRLDTSSLYLLPLPLKDIKPERWRRITRDAVDDSR